jgi:hypothetical protein
MHVVHVFFNFELGVSYLRLIEDDLNFDTRRLKTNPFTKLFVYSIASTVYYVDFLA